jgi:hypothetical protein
MTQTKRPPAIPGRFTFLTFAEGVERVVSVAGVIFPPRPIYYRYA